MDTTDIAAMTDDALARAYLACRDADRMAIDPANTRRRDAVMAEIRFRAGGRCRVCGVPRDADTLALRGGRCALGHCGLPTPTVEGPEVEGPDEAP